MDRPARGERRPRLTFPARRSSNLARRLPAPPARLFPALLLGALSVFAVAPAAAAVLVNNVGQTTTHNVDNAISGRNIRMKGAAATTTPSVTLSVAPNPVTEGSPVTATATLSAALTGAVTIPLRLKRVTAEPGDIVPLTGIWIAAGATSGTGTITTRQDTDTEDETFTVALVALPASVTAGTPNSATVTITDDDEAASPPPDDNNPPPDDNNPPRGGGGGGGGGGARNQPPEATADIAAQVLDVGADAQLDLTDHFRDPERRDMTFAAASANTGVATVTVTGSTLAVRGVAHGATPVTVTATDHRGLTATQTFTVAVGWTLGFAAAQATAAEGDSAKLTIALNRVRETDTTVAYMVGADTDPATADADAADHDAADGMLTIAAGALEATLEIAVHDDADIEPARETFVVTLQPPDGDPAPWGLGLAATAVRIAEGVCDRTPQVRDALRGPLRCSAVTADDLARVRTLDVSGTNVPALQSADLAGLLGLRVLDLSDNALTALPDGLFAGLGTLAEMDLTGNPGAPFVLTVTVARIDAAPWARGPARLELRVRTALPFALLTDPEVDRGRLWSERMRIGAGRLASTPFTVVPAGDRTTVLTLTVPPVPATRCGENDEVACFRGVETAAGPPLVLFRAPPRAVSQPRPLQVGTDGDTARAALGGVFRGADRGPLRCSAVSSDPALATVTVDADCVLRVRSTDSGAEGTVTITVTAADAYGLTGTVTFEVTVSFVQRGMHRGWRRLLLQDALPATAADDGQAPPTADI